MSFDYYRVYYLSILFYRYRRIINNIFVKDHRLYKDIIRMISLYKPFQFYEYITLGWVEVYDVCKINKPKLLDINLDYKETIIYDMYKDEYGNNDDIKSIGDFVKNTIKKDNIEIISVYLCEKKEGR